MKRKYPYCSKCGRDGFLGLACPKCNRPFIATSQKMFLAYEKITKVIEFASERTYKELLKRELAFQVERARSNASAYEDAVSQQQKRTEYQRHREYELAKINASLPEVKIIKPPDDRPGANGLMYFLDALRG